MKRITLFTLIGFVASIFTIQAQTQYEAIRLTQSDLNGTARYMSMGGAFGSLGGDASALKDNPAGLGVYRSSEITATLDANFHNANATWLNRSFSENKNDLYFNNFSYILSIPSSDEKTSGLLNSNFSFTFNKQRNFGSKMSAIAGNSSPFSFTDFLADFTTTSMNVYGTKLADIQSSDTYDPYGNSNVSWLSVMGYQGYLINPPANEGGNWSSILYNNEKVFPAAYVSEYGALNDYSFGWGGNFNNNLFVGANINVTDMNYTMDSQISEQFTAVNGYFDLMNKYSLSGIGVNLKLGVIYLPTNNLRFGLSLHTPTFYSITENTNFDLKTSETSNPYLPYVPYSQDFNLTSATEAQISASYLFGNKGLISAEYNFINYPGMRFSYSGSSADYADVNNNMGTVLRNGQVLKVGGEYKINPSVALRAGYAHYVSPMNPDYLEGKSISLNTANTNTGYFNEGNTNFATAGIGYRQSNWFIDFAYVLKMQKEDYYPYQRFDSTTGNQNIITPASITRNIDNFVVTLGFRM